MAPDSAATELTPTERAHLITAANYRVEALLRMDESGRRANFRDEQTDALRSAVEKLLGGGVVTDAATLTSSDPEPPVGTVVRDRNGDLWHREAPDPSIDGCLRGWFPIETDGSFVNDDPETWTRVAGNQGPVEVINGT